MQSRLYSVPLINEDSRFGFFGFGGFFGVLGDGLFGRRFLQYALIVDLLKPTIVAICPRDSPSSIRSLIISACCSGVGLMPIIVEPV